MHSKEIQLEILPLVGLYVCVCVYKYIHTYAIMFKILQNIKILFL
jgi:hypothetical protein